MKELSPLAHVIQVYDGRDVIPSSAQFIALTLISINNMYILGPRRYSNGRE